MAEFICPTQINRDYFTVDDNGLIIPKVYPTVETCSGALISSTNGVLTKDTLDINTTVPTTVVTTPDTTTTPYTKAVKVNTGCNEDIYVPQVPLRGENDGVALNTAGATIAQRVIHDTANPAEIRTYVENYVDNTLYVDLTYGNNATGLRERSDRPFATLAAAVLSSQPGDTIILRNGNYSIGSITIPHNITIFADKGSTITGGAFIIGANNKLSYYGGNINASANIFQILGSGSLDFEVDTLTLTGPAIRINDSVANINNKIRYRVGKHINNSVAKDGFIKTTGSGSSTGLDIDGIIYSTEGGFGSFFGAHQINNSNIIMKVYGDIDFGASSVPYFAHLSGINNRFDISIEGIFTKAASTISNPAFRALGTYSNIGNFYVKEYIGGTYLFIGNSIGNEYFIGGENHTSTSIEPTYIMESSPVAIAGISTANKIVVNTVEVYNTSTVTAPVVPGYTNNTQGIVLGIYRGGEIIINSKIMKSSKGHVIGIDYLNTGSTSLVSNTNITIFGTLIERLGRDSGIGYGGAIFFDKGTDINSTVTIKFKNGVVINNFGDNFMIDGLTGTSPIHLEYYDEVTSNVYQLNSNIDTVNYIYLQTDTISLAGTYTVLENDNDLYYDLSLGSLTFVLPDPNKYINREIELKITGLHPTNTVTIDPVGANLIENVATRVVPNTATLYTGVTFKSQGGKRWIK